MSNDKSNWQIVRFDQMVAQISERVEPDNVDVDIYVGLEHLDPESLKIRRWGTPDAVGATKLRFYPGDVIFGRRRFYQRKLAVAEFHGICSAHAMVLRAKPEVVLPEFLPFFMQSEIFYERAMRISQGSLSPTINWTSLKKQEFALPPLDAQRRIAEILWAAEEAIERYAKVSNLLRSTQIAVFESLLEKCGAAESKNILADALQDIVAGKSPRGRGTPADVNEYGVLKVSAVSQWGFREEENKALSDQNDFRPEYEVKPGSLLVTRANANKSGVARACIVEQTRSGLMLSDKTLCLVVNPAVASKRYLLEALRGSMFRNYVEVAATGTEAKNISQSKLMRAPIPLPNLQHQMQIEAVLLQSDETVSTVDAHIEQLGRLKRKLLNKELL